MRARVSTRRRSGALLAAVLVLTSLGACGDDESRPTAGGATREGVAEGGVELVGQTVTVSGVVNEGSGPQALQIAGEGMLFDGKDVLVVGRSLPSVGVGARVEVTGVVRRFDLAELEREVGTDLPVEPGAYDTAIVASDVKLVDPGGTYRAPS